MSSLCLAFSVFLSHTLLLSFEMLSVPVRMVAGVPLWAALEIPLRHAELAGSLPAAVSFVPATQTTVPETRYVFYGGAGASVAGRWYTRALYRWSI